MLIRRSDRRTRKGGLFEDAPPDGGLDRRTFLRRSGLTGGLATLGALSLGRRGALIVGVGMIPRGEVGVVIASLGLAAGVFSNRIYAVIVAMSLLTSIVTPPVLAVLLRRKAGDEPAVAATPADD